MSVKKRQCANIIVTNVFINDDKEKIRIEVNKKIENLLKNTGK